MGARVLGAAWRATAATVNAGVADGWVVASTDTTRNPSTVSPFTQDASNWELTAGQPVSIRWGGVLDATVYQNTGTNRADWILYIEPETSGGGILVDSASVGGSSGNWSMDRTISWTPTKSGTYRIYARVQIIVVSTSSILALINTDHGTQFGGETETLPAGNGDWNGSNGTGYSPGLVRAGTTLSCALSGLRTPGAYGDTATFTLTLGAGAFGVYSSENYTVNWRNAAQVQFLQTSISSTTSTTPNTSLAVNNTWPAAATALDIQLVPGSSALSTANGGAGLPWIHFTALPTGPGTVTGTADGAGFFSTIRFAGAATVDPRFTKVGLLQVNDNAWGTPPLNKDVPTHQRQTSDLGFVAMRYRDAAGAGVNGLSVNHTLQDASGLTAAITWSDTTATEGTDAGWTNTLQSWTAGLPGGSWKHTTTVTAPAGATGLESGFDALTLLAKNPNYFASAQCEQDAQPLDHFYPGQALDIRYALADTSLHKSLALDAAPTFVVRRWNATAQYYEYLGSDFAWHPWTVGNVAYFFTMTVSPGDANTYIYQFTAAQTSGWTGQNLIIGITSVVNGTPYPSEFALEVTGSADLHSVASSGGAASGLDAVDFALQGNISFT